MKKDLSIQKAVDFVMEHAQEIAKEEPQEQAAE